MGLGVPRGNLLFLCCQMGTVCLHSRHQRDVVKLTPTLIQRFLTFIAPAYGTSAVQGGRRRLCVRAWADSDPRARWKHVRTTLSLRKSDGKRIFRGVYLEETICTIT